MTESIDPVDQQIRELSALFDHLNLRYAWLANTFAMLTPLCTDKGLEDRLFKSGKLLGASPVARALFNTCVLDVCTLLLDDDQTKINPSLKRLIRPFLRKAREKNSGLLDRLATLYSKNQDRRRQFRDAAEKWAEVLTSDWAQLQKASEQLVQLRKQWIAHNEVKWNPTTQRYCGPDRMKSTVELYPDLKVVVLIITRSVVHLARILGKGEIKLKKFERKIKEQSAIFWDLSVSEPSIDSKSIANRRLKPR
jgi:hypothetical protein